jgi:hypothetical protein
MTCSVWVVIKLVKDDFSFTIKHKRNFYFPDYMEQASSMAKPYITDGWHLVHAKQECICGKT